MRPDLTHQLLKKPFFADDDDDWNDYPCHNDDDDDDHDWFKDGKFFSFTSASDAILETELRLE